jgi:hypothetical protein
MRAVAGTVAENGETIKTTKRTRRRGIQQKRTRNTNRPKIVDDKTSSTAVASKPVLESTNPFFIAVCAPDTYKPASSSIPSSGNGLSTHRGGGGGGRHGRVQEDNEWEKGSRQRRLPNVFLRSNSRNSSSSASSAPAMINPFIHHPIIQNDRLKGDNSFIGGRSNENISTGTGTGAVTGTGTGNGVNKTNVDDKEQFPALSAGAGAGTGAQTKLNFKEMILKNSNNTSGGAVSAVAAPAAVSNVTPVPKVRTEYAQQQPQKVLSSGNIFLGAFYGPKDNEYVCSDDDHDDEVDVGGGGGGGGGRGGGSGVISSILIDSCDRKYDNLYR